MQMARQQQEANNRSHVMAEKPRPGVNGLLFLESWQKIVTTNMNHFAISTIGQFETLGNLNLLVI
jgi:hypothetical protein